MYLNVNIFACPKDVIFIKSIIFIIFFIIVGVFILFHKIDSHFRNILYIEREFIIYYMYYYIHLCACACVYIKNSFYIQGAFKVTIYFTK